MRYVKLFGVELEGGWDEEPELPDNFHEDGSVNVRGEWRVGEIVSRPMATLKEARQFIDGNYPEHVGATCGMHVHMSFVNNVQAISLIAENKEYQDGLLATLRKLGERCNVRNSHFWSRLNGENEFCRSDWNEGSFRMHERYRMVNFCSFEKHGTLEVRLLPMFRMAKLAKRFMRRVLAYTDAYLAKVVPTDEPFEFDIETPDGFDISEVDIDNSESLVDTAVDTENFSLEI